MQHPLLQHLVGYDYEDNYYSKVCTSFLSEIVTPGALTSSPKVHIIKNFKMPPARPTDRPNVPEQQSGNPLSFVLKQGVNIIYNI